MSKMATRWDALLGIAIGKATALWAIASVYTLSANCVLAQITPDATLPNNSIVNINGNTFNITGGTQAGTNLFHSFQQFSVGTGSQAFFNNTVDIQNIISRVTGGLTSNIDGLIRTLGTANLFLINPNGIVFGQNARLEIGGSFFASTASSLKFADGTEFRTNGTQSTPLLTISVPLGLQFGANPGKITVQGSGHNLTYDQSTFGTIRGDVPRLQVQPGRTLALVGGDVVLEGGNLRAESGRIELGSVASPALVSLTQKDSGFTLGYSGIENFGNILLSQKASVDASGEGGGSIQVQSRQLSVKDGSSILSITSGAKPGGDFTVNATESVELIGESADRKYASSLLTESQGAGSSGDLLINTRKLTTTDGAYVSTFITSSGKGGNLTIKASDSVELLGRGIYESGLYTGTSSGSSGNAGELKVETRNLNVKNSATVFTNSAGQGNGGDIFIQASDGLFVSNARIASIAPSRGGNITINSGSFSLQDGGQLQTSIFGLSDIQPVAQGQAGNVNIKATGAVDIVGRRGTFPSAIFSNVGTGTQGNGGNITIDSDSFSLRDGARLNASTSGQGNAGNVTVRATGKVSWSNSAVINSVATSGVGNGGSVNIQGREVSLANSVLATSTLGKGNSGNLQIKADDSIVVSDSIVTSGTFGQGNAGSITIEGNLVSLVGNSSVLSTVGVGGVGKGGNIDINAASLSLRDGAQLSASTYGQGDAGSILVQAKDSVSVIGNSYIFSNVSRSKTFEIRRKNQGFRRRYSDFRSRPQMIAFRFIQNRGA